VVDLHEDMDSPGYYLYQHMATDEERLIGHLIVNRVRSLLPINRYGEIEGRSADGGVIERACAFDDMRAWPLALYALSHGASRRLTLEAPAACLLELRVSAHLFAIQIALKSVGRYA
jgi:murein peptide amidase A